MMLFSWSSRHSVRAASSGRLERTPSSSRHTLLECSVRDVFGGEAGVTVFWCSNQGG
jgi:hypothetical protein